MRKRIERDKTAGDSLRSERPKRSESTESSASTERRSSRSSSTDPKDQPRSNFSRSRRNSGPSNSDDQPRSPRRSYKTDDKSDRGGFEKRDKPEGNKFEGNRRNSEVGPGRAFRERSSPSQNSRPNTKDRSSSDERPRRGRNFTDRRESGEQRSETGPFRPERRPSFGRENSTGERSERSSRPSRPFSSDRSGRGVRPGRNERTDRNERPGRRSDRFEGTERKRDFSFDGGDRPNYRPFKPFDKKRQGRKPLTEGPKTIRLNKYIADSGVCSRREADELIRLGEVKVNGKTITEMGYQVNPTDTVKYGNRTLSREKMVYILMNKPKDFITTLDDPEGRKTVVDILGSHVKERVYPVGRLDRNTTGLLLLTNDGELADKLSHPSNNIKKIYQVEIDQPISKEDVQKLRNGVVLEDGPASIDNLELLEPNSQVIGLELHSGRNRIVRRLFEHLGYKVTKLDRVMYAELTKKDLPRGAWRHLTEKEVIRLKYFI